MSRIWKPGLFLLGVRVLACSLVLFQGLALAKRHAVLVLIVDQPIRPFARDVLEGIQEATRDAIDVSLFVEFLGPTALESQSVAAQRRQLLATRYASEPIEVVVAVGDRTVPEAEKLRHDHFPSAKLVFLVALRETLRTGVHQGEGLHVDSNPFPSVQLALSLLPEKSRLIVVSGISTIDQALRKSIADSLDSLPRKIDANYLNGLPLPELLEEARRFPAESIVVMTTGMVDRSGRSTTNRELASGLSNASNAPVIEGSDVSLGYGTLGGDVASYRLTGQDIGKRIRRILDTGQAPAGVTIDPAPRRKALDWRELKRIGVSENRVPDGFEILYREPELWQQHRTAILVGVGTLVLQAFLISLLLTERRRRAEVQARMQRQLRLEATVSKASAALSAATHVDWPARLQDVLLGLSECLGIERASVWIYEPKERAYVATHWWPDLKSPVKRDPIVKRFPYLHSELLAGKTITMVGLDELAPNSVPDVAELKALGFASLAVIPLRLGKQPVGALILGTSSHSAKWDSEVASTLEVLGNVVAQALSRSTSERRVRHSEEQSRAMLASIPGFVLMIDGTGQILSQNNRLDLGEASLPVALARASLGQNFLKLWGSDGESGKNVALALAEIAKGQKASVVLEHRYETERGTRWIEVHAESLYGEQRGAVISQTDITERKRNESENAQNRQAAWHLNRVAALGELTASLAHEINQPLAAILNSAEAALVMLNRPVPDVAETLEAVRDIIDDDKRAGAVISRMRSMLKRGQERTQPVDLNATVDETLRLVANEARLRHVTLHHAATRDLPPIAADPTQLQQVILNLVTNGIQAAEMMPAYRHVEVRTSGVPSEGMLLLEVRDSGPGIPPERLADIFEPFYTSKREGLGLGLSICRSIVDTFGGKIAAESPPEGGAVFRVVLRTFVRASQERRRVMKAGA